MSSTDSEWDHDVVGDSLPPWGARRASSNSELDHDGATDDDEVDRTESGGGELTTGAGGINVVVVGDGETNANLGDDMRDRDGACDDSEVDRTRRGGGE